ncbi:hypothetical protein PTKIN_Ptkin16aG0479100 [Pterospermum kingtungense]
MAATKSTKKIPIGFIAMFLVVFILCQGFAKAGEDDEEAAAIHTDSEMPHIGQFTPGMPLYRKRSDPHVLIPEYKVHALEAEIERIEGGN